MALTVETGEGLANSDSYVSLEDARAFASSRGLELPEDDAALEVLLRKAHDYLTQFEDKFSGRRTVDTQALSWPRKCVKIYSIPFDKNTIPAQIINAVCQLAVELKTVDPFPVSEGRPIVSEAVGPIKTTYADTGVASASIVSFPLVLVFLAPILNPSGMRTEVIRV